ncbi:helix-turn-helix domain-containing protein [Streptacidiphilus cavernicola]|uniref:Helix-turn-helix domain-containing protein n=1 Tax=Streptacidiphilus cavernicola TaxID=3342716 RepID=A0ABV6VSC6_9ACTN
MHTVALAVHDGISLFEAASACEVFGVDRSDLVDPWYSFTVCGPDRARVGGWMRSDLGHGLGSLLEADTVVVPACHDLDEGPPDDLVQAVRAAYDHGARVVSLCTGAFVLAAAGLLDGRRATTHWLHAEALAARYPRVEVDPDVLYVDNGRVLTSAGKSAAMDLCLHVVRLDHGAAVANALARRLVVPPHRTGGQAQFIPAPVPAPDTAPLADLLQWASARLDQPLTVTDLARQAGLSPRQLTRRFNAVTGTTPLQWLLNQRLHRAQELLETTDGGIEQIAARTGMGTATTLRRHFNRVVGVPPDSYRQTFRERS